MFTLINIMPWQVWAIIGIFGTPLLIRWIIKATKNDPFLLRLAWVVIVLLGIYMTFDSFSKGMNVNLISPKVSYGIAIVGLAVMFPLMFVGGYRKVMQPSYDLGKRRMYFLALYALIGGVILIGGTIIVACFWR